MGCKRELEVLLAFPLQTDLVRRAEIALDHRIILGQSLQSPDTHRLAIAGNGLLKVGASLPCQAALIRFTQVILNLRVLIRQGFQGPAPHRFTLPAANLPTLSTPFSRNT